MARIVRLSWEWSEFAPCEGVLTMVERSGDRDRVKGGMEELKGNAKQAWGDITDDDQMKAEGKVDEAKGRAQQAMGDLKDKATDIKDDVAREMSR
jgi:uncharacterized protein YjbJ (UPF0337 family)